MTAAPEILPLLRQGLATQADGGMGIVAAGVHLSGVEGDEVMGVLFLNWQGVDITLTAMVGPGLPPG